MRAESLRAAPNLGRIPAVTAGVPALAWIGVIAVAVAVLYGRGHVGYDGMYTLLWGRELAHGSIPDLRVPIAPTPHPLAIVVAAFLTPFGAAAATLSQAVTIVAFAALGWAAFQLGRELYSVAVGVLVMAILLTRPLLVVGELQASVDIPFLALVVWACVLEARRPHTGRPVVVALAIAGLLRPEAWLLAALYWLYLLPGTPVRQRAALAAMTAAAPLLWLAFDLAITGDPLHSLHETQSNAEVLERPRHVDEALQAAPVYLQQILYEPIVWGGIAGAVAALCALYERSVLPAAVTALGLMAFVALGAFGLPLLTRYLLLPAAMLALFCAVAALGWLSLPRTRPLRAVWIAASAILVTALVLSVPGERERMARVHSFTDATRAVQDDLRDVVTAAGVADVLERCPPPIQVPNFRVVPFLAYTLDKPASAFAPRDRRPRRGAVISPLTRAVAAGLVLYTGERIPAVGSPAGFRRIEVNRTWVLSARC
ncbi:MAG TPA: hypothetical protein VGJ32_04780 [Solirubrobacteraceae bacterium]